MFLKQYHSQKQIPALVQVVQQVTTEDMKNLDLIAWLPEVCSARRKETTGKTKA
jgi:Tfp pilus assembly protein PilO